MAGPTPSRPNQTRRPIWQWRTAVLGAALTAGALALVGCGSDDDDADASASRTASARPTTNPTTTAESEAGGASATPSATTSNDASATPTPAPTADMPTTPVAPTTPAPPTTAPVSWAPPEGTVPGRCGGNGMDGRQSINGWEVCWTEGTISPQFAVNVASAVAANGFAPGTYQAESPSAGAQTIECFRFNAPGSGTTIISCSGGTVSEGAAIELAWLG